MSTGPLFLRRLSLALTALLVAGSATLAVAPAASAATSACMTGSTPLLNTTVTCATPGEYTLEVPAGVTSVDLDVVGAGGGAGYPARQHIGGNAARVTGELALPQGTASLYVIVGAGGGGNNNGRGYGGGGSGVLALDAQGDLIAKLSIAGAGGGGAYNGDGGNAGSAGTSENPALAAPGQPGVASSGGAGGIGNFGSGASGASNNPGSTTIAGGGFSGLAPGGSAGGTGGGGYGGGGGGGAGTQGILNVFAAGGGGGSSLASAYLGSASISIAPGTGGIQLPGLIAGDGRHGSVTLTFAGAATPGAPTGASATAGDAEATVSFTAPASSGAEPIESYTVTSNPGGVTSTCSTSPCTVTGLSNGTAYTFTVTATNGVGTGTASEATNEVTPARLSDAPSIGTATAGDGEATVAFTAPATTGGSAIIDYTATSNPGGLTGTCTTSPCTVTGLTNGTAYTFTVTARNGVGSSAASGASGSVTPAGLPAAPTSATATAGDAQATVSFTAGNDNGSTVDEYTVTSTPGGLTGTCSTSPCIVTGLTNGTAYTFTVTATNGVGTGAASEASNEVTPATVSDAPRIDAVEAGDGEATVSFTAPLSTGGSALLDYTVLSAPGGISATCTTSPCIVTGLTNGTAYTFTATARNGVGSSAASASSDSVIPAGLAEAPVDAAATAGDGQATISFVPGSDNGSTIETYTVTSTPGGLTGSCASSPCVVSGLTNGTEYTFTVTATNGLGTGIASTPTDAVTPATVPAAPTDVSATTGNRSAVVTFTAPVDDGGSPITSFTVTSTPGGAGAVCDGSPCTVTGLDNGVAYTFTVTADNRIGSSVASSSSTAVIPVTTPGAPRSVTTVFGDRSAVVSFEPPAEDGGSPITGYRITNDVDDLTVSCTSSPCTVTGLTNGVSYSFTVVAVNAQGAGTASVASAAGSPRAEILPSAPAEPTPAGGGTAAPAGESLADTGADSAAFGTIAALLLLAGAALITARRRIAPRSAARRS